MTDGDERAPFAIGTGTGSWDGLLIISDRQTCRAWLRADNPVDVRR